MRARGRLPKGVRVMLLILVALLVVPLVLCTLFYQITDYTNGTLTVAGEKRRYLLHVPASYTPDRPTALVISLHGFAQWPYHQSLVTHWPRLADEYGFIVVHPAGTGFPKRWRANTADALQQPDVAFLEALIDHLAAQYAIDPQRIYINGLSNGGGMSWVMSCALAERIAAWGGVGGAYAFPEDQCQPSRPVPAIIFHGVQDQIVPYEGGAVNRLEWRAPNIPAWVDAYAQRNGCTLPAEQEDITPNVTRFTYRDCAADVVFYRIADGGHTWPGGDMLPASITGPTNREIDATALMWAFFSAHPLPEKP